MKRKYSRLQKLSSRCYDDETIEGTDGGTYITRAGRF